MLKGRQTNYHFMPLFPKSRKQIFDRILAGYEGNVQTLNASAIRNMRVRQQHQVLTDQVSTISYPLYDGEEQTYLLRFLVESAKSVFKPDYSPGSISANSLLVSTQYSLLARYLSLGSFKAMSEQISADILQNSELQLVLNKARGTTPPSSSKGADVVNALYIALKEASVGQIAPDFFTAEAVSPAIAQELLTATDVKYTTLMTFIGTSRGMPLTSQWRTERIKDYNLILDAIAWLAQIDGAMLGLKYTKKGTAVTPEELEAEYPERQLDAWTLLVGFRTYLKWEAAPESPFQPLPPPTSPLTAAQNLKRYANYLSVVYAQIGTAYISGELTMAFKAYKDTFQVWHPLIATRPQLVKVLDERLAAIEGRYKSPHEFTVAATNAATGAYMKYFEITSWLLPGEDAIMSLRDTVLEKLPESHIVTNFEGVSKLISKSLTATFTMREVIAKNFDSFLDVLEAAVALYGNSSKLQELMLLDNLGIGSQFVLTTGDFVYSDAVAPLKVVKYASLVDRSPMVSVMPRFQPRKSIEEPSKWIFRDEKTKPLYAILTALSKLDSAHRFVWPNRGSIALGETVTIPYMSLPIPSAYTSDIDGELQPYGVPSFLGLIAGHTDGIPSREYLQNFFATMEATEGQWTDLLMNAICGAFIVQKKSGGIAWTTVYPGIPTIYGAPSKQLINFNISSKELKWISLDPIDEVTYRIAPYVFVPRPMPSAYVPYQWTRGCFINVAVGIHFVDPDYVNGVKAIYAATYDHETILQSVDAMSFKPDAGADESVLLMRSYGWSNFVTTLPHVLFKVASPYSAAFNNNDVDIKSAATVKTMIKREPELGIVSFIAVFDDTIMYLDEDDEQAAMKFSSGDPLSVSVSGDSPSVLGTETPATRKLGDTTITSAPANSDPVVDDQGTNDAPKPTIGGPGQSAVPASGPLPDSAVAVATGKSPATRVVGTAPIEPVADQDTLEEGAIEGRGGALKGAPAKAKPAKEKPKADSPADSQDAPATESSIQAQIDEIDELLKSANPKEAKVLRTKKAKLLEELAILQAGEGDEPARGGDQEE